MGRARGLGLKFALAASCLSATACFDYRDPVYDDLGSVQSCASFELWEGEWAARERDMVLALSSLRALEGSCGEQEFGGNAPRLELVPELRCAAREHAANMGHRRKLSHTGGDGRGPTQRIYDAGYQGIPRGELIARGELDPEAAIAGWLADPEQCAAILDRELDEVGAGLWVRGKNDAYWVLTLGTRR